MTSILTQLLLSASKYMYFTDDNMFTLDEDMCRNHHTYTKDYTKLKLPM